MFRWSHELLEERAWRENLQRTREQLPSLVHKSPKITRARVGALWRAARVAAVNTVKGSAEDAQIRIAERMLDTLRDNGTDVTLLFVRNEPMYHELVRHRLAADRERWPNLTVQVLPSEDHIIRALPIQAIVNDRIDAALQALTAGWP